MNLQVLVATMHQEDHSLLEKMNINSDAIIVNQCGKNEYENIEYNGHDIKIYSFSERGVGLNRNNSLMRATADICLLSDDDVVLENNYSNLIIRSFEENSDADVIIFNLKEEIPKRFIIKKKMKIGRLNYMRFGAVRIAFKRKSITKNGISFNLNFGGGTEYSAGEDSLFLKDCIKNKLKIIGIPITISTLKDERPSTWFKGYNDKFFIDKGALFAALSKKLSLFYIIQFAFRRKKLYSKETSLSNALKYMMQGRRKYYDY